LELCDCDPDGKNHSLTNADCLFNKVIATQEIQPSVTFLYNEMQGPLDDETEIKSELLKSTSDDCGAEPFDPFGYDQIVIAKKLASCGIFPEEPPSSRPNHKPAAELETCQTTEKVPEPPPPSDLVPPPSSNKVLPVDQPTSNSVSKVLGLYCGLSKDDVCKPVPLVCRDPRLARNNFQVFALTGSQSANNVVPGVLATSNEQTEQTESRANLAKNRLSKTREETATASPSCVDTAEPIPLGIFFFIFVLKAF